MFITIKFMLQEAVLQPELQQALPMMLEQQVEDVALPAVLDRINGYSGAFLLSQLPGVESRGYQEKCLDKSILAFHQGITKTQWVIPTAGGKTVMAMAMVNQAKRSLLLFPSNIALRNAVEEYEKFGIGKSFQVIQGRNNFNGFDPNCEVTFASVQTINKNGRSDDEEGIFDGFAPKDHFDLVVVDEAHHFMGEQYRQVPLHFEDAAQLWMTATPGNTVWELDQFVPHRSADMTYDDLAKHEGYPDMVVCTHQVKTDRLSEAKAVCGRLRVPKSKRAEVLNLSHRYEISEKITFDAIEKGEKVLGFMDSTTSSSEFVDEYQKNHPEHADKIAHVDGKMSDKRIGEVYEAFKRGDILAVYCCDLWNESLNIKDIKHLVLADVCYSPAKTFQRIGRAAREAEGKDEFFVHDIVSSIADMDPDDFGKMMATPKSVAGMMGYKRIPKGGKGLVVAGKDAGKVVTWDDVAGNCQRKLVSIAEVETEQIHYTQTVRNLKALSSRKVAVDMFRTFAEAFSTNLLGLTMYPEAYLESDVELAEVVDEKSGRSFPVTFKNVYDAARFQGTLGYVRDIACSEVGILAGEIKGRVREAREGVSQSEVPAIADNPFDEDRLPTLLAPSPFYEKFFKEVFGRVEVGRRADVLVDLSYGVNFPEWGEFKSVCEANGFFVEIDDPRAMFGPRAYVKVLVAKSREVWEGYVDNSRHQRVVLNVDEDIGRRYKLAFRSDPKFKGYSVGYPSKCDRIDRDLGAKLERAKDRGDRYVVFSPQEVARDGARIAELVGLIRNMGDDSPVRFVHVFRREDGSVCIPIDDIEMCRHSEFLARKKSKSLLPEQDDGLSELFARVELSDPLHEKLWALIAKNACTKGMGAKFSREYAAEVPVGVDDVLGDEERLQQDFVSEMEAFHAAVRGSGVILASSAGGDRFYVDFAPLFGQAPQVADRAFVDLYIKSERVMFSQEMEESWHGETELGVIMFYDRLWSLLKNRMVGGAIRTAVVDYSELNELARSVGMNDVDFTLSSDEEGNVLLKWFVQCLNWQGVLIEIAFWGGGNCRFRLGDLYQYRESGERARVRREAEVREAKLHVGLEGCDENGLSLSDVNIDWQNDDVVMGDFPFKSREGTTSLEESVAQARYGKGAYQLSDEEWREMWFGVGDLLGWQETLCGMYGIGFSREELRHLREGTRFWCKEIDFSRMVPVASSAVVPAGAYLRCRGEVCEIAGARKLVPLDVDNMPSQWFIKKIYDAVERGDEVMEFSFNELDDAREVEYELMWARKYFRAHGYGGSILAPCDRPSTSGCRVSLRGINIRPFEVDMEFEPDLAPLRVEVDYGTESCPAGLVAEGMGEVAGELVPEGPTREDYAGALTRLRDVFNGMLDDLELPRISLDGEKGMHLLGFKKDDLTDLKELLRYGPFFMVLSPCESVEELVAGAERLMDDPEQRRMVRSVFHDVFPQWLLKSNQLANYYGNVTATMRSKGDVRWYEREGMAELMESCHPGVCAAGVADFREEVQAQAEAAVEDLPRVEEYEAAICEIINEWNEEVTAARRSHLSINVHREARSDLFGEGVHRMLAERLRYGVFVRVVDEEEGRVEAARQLMANPAQRKLASKAFKRLCRSVDLSYVRFGSLQRRGMEENWHRIPGVCEKAGSVDGYSLDDYVEAFEKIRAGGGGLRGKTNGNLKVFYELFWRVANGDKREAERLMDDVAHRRLAAMALPRVFSRYWSRESSFRFYFDNYIETFASPKAGGRRGPSWDAFVERMRVEAGPIDRLVLDSVDRRRGAEVEKMPVVADYERGFRYLAHWWDAHIVDEPMAYDVGIGNGDGTDSPHQVDFARLCRVGVFITALLPDRFDDNWPKNIAKLAVDSRQRGLAAEAFMNVFGGSRERVERLFSDADSPSDLLCCDPGDDIRHLVDTIQTNGPAVEFAFMNKLVAEAEAVVEAEPTQADYNKAIGDMLSEWNDWARGVRCKYDIDFDTKWSVSFRNVDMIVLNERLRYGVFVRVAGGDMQRARKLMDDPAHMILAKNALRHVMGTSRKGSIMSFGLVSKPLPHEDWADIPGLMAEDVVDVTEFGWVVRDAFSGVEFANWDNAMTFNSQIREAILTSLVRVEGADDPDRIREMAKSTRFKHMLLMSLMRDLPKEIFAANIMRFLRAIKAVAESSDEKLRRRCAVEPPAALRNMGEETRTALEAALQEANIP